MFYPGQFILATDGARYVLTHQHATGAWWGVRAGQCLPCPVVPRYPCWGGDDERVGADQAGHLPRVPQARRGRRVAMP